MTDSDDVEAWGRAGTYYILGEDDSIYLFHNKTCKTSRTWMYNNDNIKNSIICKYSYQKYVRLLPKEKVNREGFVTSILISQSTKKPWHRSG